MIIKREIGEKGQVVIPKDIRNFLGLRVKGNIVFEISGNNVLIRKEENPEKIVNDFCNIPGKKENISAGEIKDIIMEPYEDEVSRY